jgi:recombination protein RecA
MAIKKKEEKVKEEVVKGLEATLEAMNKKYGIGTIINGKDVEKDLEVVSTGSLGLDQATYIGGIPIGKLIEIYGQESSGKSTITLHIIAEFQKKGKKCVLIDSEQSFDRKYATALGIDVDAILKVQPECAEDGYNIAQSLIKTGEIGLVVLDSQTGLVPRGVLNGEVGDAKMALAARVNSEALQKIHPILKSNKCSVIAVSQLRTDIGAYGDPAKPTGGLAYKFYSDMRLKVEKQISKETESNKTTVTVIKNKCGAPYGQAIFSINWGTGIDRILEVIDRAIEK